MANIRLFDFWKVNSKDGNDLIFTGKNLKTVDKVYARTLKDGKPEKEYTITDKDVEISFDGTVGIARGINLSVPDTLDELEVTVEHVASSSKDTEKKELPV